VKSCVPAGRTTKRRNGKILVIHNRYAVVNSTGVEVFNDCVAASFTAAISSNMLPVVSMAKMMSIPCASEAEYLALLDECSSPLLRIRTTSSVLVPQYFARYVMKYFSGYDCLLTQRRLVAIYAKSDLSTSLTTKYSVRRLKEVSKLLFF
jgi:hypothetical protein